MRKNSKTQKIAEYLRGKIADGDYAPGSQLPSENELCAQLQLSRVSIRRGMDILEKEGIIVRRPGIGSFVRNPNEVPTSREICIGLSDTPMNYFYSSDIARGVRNVCSLNNIRLEIVEVDDYFDHPDRRVDGLILVNARTSRTPEELNRIASALPLVFINRVSDLPNIAYYSVNYEEESRRATDLMLRWLGPLQIGIVSSLSVSIYASFSRIAGCRSACTKYGAVPLNFDVERNSYEVVDHIANFISQNKIRIIFIAINNLLEYVLLACRKLGLEPGKDLFIYGFCSIDRLSPLAEKIHLHISMPLLETSQAAANWLIRRIISPETTPVHKQIVPANFVFNSNSLFNCLESSRKDGLS